jgi:superfamily II DNA or RNA helicase
MIKLRTYQQGLYDGIQNKLKDKNVRSICAVLPTGGGKSVVIAKLAQELKGRTLILTHRIEILQQNSEWLQNSAVLTSKDNTLSYDTQVVIAMVQTAYARIKKYGIEYLGDFDNIILDEVQVLIFKKVFEQYNYKKLIGFTGTPVLNKKKYTTINDIEYVEPYTLSEIFDTIVQGTDTEDLIDLGYLVQDYNIVLDLPNMDKLKPSSSNPDGYTTNSLNEVYANSVSIEILKNSYYRYCKGKKTLIFNATTKVNNVVYKYLKDLGLNVKMFDTVNKTDINNKTEKPYTRAEIIKWFNNERDAILINTNVFTTGFNVTDVEVIVVNRATKSLSLWIQMVGRGSRTTNKIFKDKFTVLDLGQNIYEHGIWSMRRNWEEYFYPGEKRLKQKNDVFDTWTCTNCGAFNTKEVLFCENCGEPMQKSESSNKKDKIGEFRVVSDMPIPKSFQIINYTKSRKESSNFAFKLLERKIIDLFIHYNVSSEFYIKNQSRFIERIKEIYTPIYFAIIRSELKGANKTLNNQIRRIKIKINKLYNLN